MKGKRFKDIDKLKAWMLKEKRGVDPRRCSLRRRAGGQIGIARAIGAQRPGHLCCISATLLDVVCLAPLDVVCPGHHTTTSRATYPQDIHIVAIIQQDISNQL